MTGHPKSGKPRRRIFWRIYLYGLLFCVALACAFALMRFFDDRPPPMHANISKLIEADCRSEPGRLRTTINNISLAFDTNISIYSWDGSSVMTAGPNPPLPLPPEKAQSLRSGGMPDKGPPMFAIPLHCADRIDGYVVSSFKWRPSPWPVLVTVLAVFGLLAVILLPLARTIARPLERITSTARKLGRGDFSARTGIKGSDEIGLLAGTFDEMAERLERLLRSERDLLANISHEIRTPLARIQLAVELCDEKDADVESLKGHLKGITGDLAELDRLLNDVLTMARLDLVSSDDKYPGFAMRAKPLQLKVLAEEAASRFKEKWAQYRLDVSVDDDMPPIIADPAMFRRVLDNLLDNAARYSEPSNPIDLFIGRRDSECVIEVRDLGIGIADENRERVFEPFFRTDYARSKNTGGLGLGLALCRKIVVAHGGRIEAIKNPEAGTLFRINLPFDHTISQSEIKPAGDR